MNYPMSQGQTGNIKNKKKWSFEPSGKGHISPGENVAGKAFISEYKMPISFRASVATSQDNCSKYRNYGWFSQLRDPVVKGCAWLINTLWLLLAKYVSSFSWTSDRTIKY